MGEGVSDWQRVFQTGRRCLAGKISWCCPAPRFVRVERTIVCEEEMRSEARAR